MAAILVQATENETALQAQGEDGAEKPATNKPQSVKSKETVASGEKKAGEASEKEPSAKKSLAKKAKAAGKGAKAVARKTVTKRTDAKAAEGGDGSKETKGKDGQESSKKPSTKRSELKKTAPKKFGTKVPAKKAASKKSPASKSEADEEAVGQGAADEQASESKVAAEPAKKSKKASSKKESSVKRTEGGHVEGKMGVAQSGGVDSDVDMDDLDRDPDELDDSANTEEADVDADSDKEGEDSDDKDGTKRPRGRNLTEGAISTSKGVFMTKDSDELDEPAARVYVVGTTVDSVKDYLKQIGKAPLLNAEEEVGLIRHIEAGLYARHILKSGSLDKAKDRMYMRELRLVSCDGQQAKNYLLEANLRLVVSLAKRYMGRGILFLDLIQEGSLGLVYAVEKFDFTKGFKSSTYATWWIRQVITCAMTDQARTVRVPVHMVEVVNKFTWVQRQMLQDLGRKPTTIGLVKELDIAEEKTIEVQKYGRELTSLHTPLGEDGDPEFGDLIEDSEAAVPADAVDLTLSQEQPRQVLDTLSKREADVVAVRSGLTDGQTKALDEIGKVYGVTRERAWQTESKTMSKFRHPSRSQVLCDYLD